MKNHNMWFVFSLLSLVLIAPFGAINSLIAVLAIIISGAFFIVWYIKEMKKQEKEGEMKMSNVIHPGHYNIPGRKECIEEMLDKFGYGKTEAFCELIPINTSTDMNRRMVRKTWTKHPTIRKC